MKSLFRYAAETRGFIVRVSVSFLPEQSEVGKGRWFWAYHIRIENEGLMAAQLLTRHWDIRDANGAHHLVDGFGDECWAAVTDTHACGPDYIARLSTLPHFTVCASFPILPIVRKECEILGLI